MMEVLNFWNVDLPQVPSFTFLLETASNMNNEFDALLERIRSPNTCRAGDALFSVDPPDLSITYSPDNFDNIETSPDSKSINASYKNS